MPNNKNPPITGWGQSRAIETRYFNSLRKLYRAILRKLKGAATLGEVRRRLLETQSSPAFIEFAQNLAANMAVQIDRLSGANWRARALAANNIRSREIFKSLTKELTDVNPVSRTLVDMIHRNTKMIVTLPSIIENKIAVDMAKQYGLGGMRHEQLTKQLFDEYGTYTDDWDIRQEQFDKYGQDYRFIESDARRIARTEISKAQCALTQARAEALGLRWYVWRTADDGNRVRDAHRLMHGVLVNWGDPPDPEKLNKDNKHRSKFGPYHAGNIYNCRCYPEPVIDIDWLDWNSGQKVHMGGQIKRMTKKELRQWINI